MIDWCQTTDCIAACSVWGWVPQNDQRGRADTWSMLNAPAISTWSSQLDHGTMELGDLVWWVKFFTTSCGRPCTSFTWERDGTRMHCGKRASWQRQCDALGSVIGKPWVLTFMGMLLWHTPPAVCPATRRLMRSWKVQHWTLLSMHNHSPHRRNLSWKLAWV